MRRFVFGRVGQPAFVVLTGSLFMLGSQLAANATTNSSSWAFSGTSGRIIRQPDALGNRVLDYSGVGYKGGTVPIPTVAVKTNILPVVGDNGPNIQGAINYVASLPLGTNGFRGAVLLTAGEYQVSNSIIINASGIVLRGVGDGSDTNGNTILRAAGPRPTASVSADHAPLIIIAGSGSGSTSGSARNITNNYVPVGACSFNVDSTNGLTSGSRVMITRPSPANWIHDIGMDLVSPAWTAGSFNVPSERFITRIEGSRIIVDAPLTCALEAQYGGATIKNYAWSGRITNVGIEDIRGVSDFNPSVTTNAGASSTYYSDELHALDFIETTAVENAWVQRVTAQYFGYACVHMKPGTRAVTVRDCNSLDPVSIITGERRYAFSLYDARNCLVQNCYTHNDRHQFVTDSLNTGPNVFVDGLSDNAYNDAGPHFRWGTGAIWDNITVNGNNLNVRNRGNAGTSHGWAGANEVVWNCKADGFIVESPATARNWLIGSIGPLATNTAAVGPHPDGTYDSRNTNVFPNSLYYAQLQDRLAAPNLQTREYWMGVIDGFTNGIPRDVVALDSAWSNAVDTVAAGQPLDAFNVVTNNHWIPFTFNYALGATDRVVAATLSLALRATSSAASDVIYLGSTNNSFTFSSLGWLPIGTGTNTTVGVLDLGSQLHLLTNGQFNVAVQGDAGIDWAMLELQVTPVQTLYTNSILPEADAYVRGGTNATLNFGTSTTIDVKADTSANTWRQCYLRWNLVGYSGSVLQARVRLTPISVGTNGLEHGITLTTSNQWSETTLNWNNQPGGCKRFATWIPAANVPVEFVVTPQVQAALAGDGQLSLELFSLSYVGGPGLVSYASREHGNSALRPQLLLIYSSTAPTLAASFYATPTNGGAPLPVVFTDTSTGEPTNYFWSFGDGATTNTTVTSLLHTYRFPGTNTVRLIVSGASGLSTNTQTNLIVATSVDSVGDGIPDWWRAQYFGGDGTTTNQSSCATCDPDGDGQSNSAEFLPLGGTDPTNSSSVFRITAINRIGSDLRVTWTVVTDKTYAVQVATDELNGSLSNSFVDLASVVVPPAPAIAETNYIDIGSATNAPARYYRLRLMP